MAPKKRLNNIEMKAVLEEAQLSQSPVIGSFMVDGKWQRIELQVRGYSDDFIDFYSQSSCELLEPEHPVGVCIHLGYFKYLFDSTVLATVSQSFSSRILLNPPHTIERVERRLFHRQLLPENLCVKVLFWHRGYLDDCLNEPVENYWQGRLLNLSAGGARFEIEIKHKIHFRIGQVLGIQFTPMSYQKPIFVESYVKYTEIQTDTRYFRIGAEFLGLESSPEGRQTLNRILEAVSQYEMINTQRESYQKT
jgi:hypothetical protein